MVFIKSEVDVTMSFTISWHYKFCDSRASGKFVKNIKIDG